MEDAALDEFKGLDTNDPNCVVVGLAPSKFRYDHVSFPFFVVEVVLKKESDE